MRNWTNDDRMMIACCNDDTRPVVFKIERIDVPESDKEAAWLAAQDFSNEADAAYIGRAYAAERTVRLRPTACCIMKMLSRKL